MGGRFDRYFFSLLFDQLFSFASGDVFSGYAVNGEGYVEQGAEDGKRPGEEDPE